MLPFICIDLCIEYAEILGMSQSDDSSVSLTIMRASKSVTVLELDHPLIAFAPVNISPFGSVSQQPSAVAILMKQDFRVIDLTIPGLISLFHCLYNIHCLRNDLRLNS